MIIVISAIIINLILMIMTRQEPCVYVNGKPYNVRSTDDMANHLVMTEVRLPKPQSLTPSHYQVSDISSLEQKVVKEIKKEDKFMWAQVKFVTDTNKDKGKDKDKDKHKDGWF